MTSKTKPSGDYDCLVCPDDGPGTCAIFGHRFTVWKMSGTLCARCRTFRHR